MPHNVDIKVFLIGRSMPGSGLIEWLKELGVSEAGVKRVAERDTAAETLIEAAGRRCYKSFDVGLNPNVTRIREEIESYVSNLLASGHGSVLEHMWFNFGIEGVSRVFTGEMNRHRAGTAISEASMRFIRYDDIPWWMPTSIKLKDSDDTTLMSKKIATQSIFDKAFKHAEKHYAELLEVWKDELAPDSKFSAKKEITSMMRRIIPMGVATGGVWSMNLRALRHVLELRGSPAAEEEILVVAHLILDVMRVEEPTFFADYNVNVAGFIECKYHKV